jgi:hypothetical protein
MCFPTIIFPHFAPFQCLLIPALFIVHWLFAVEEAGLEAITDEETKVYKLLSDLLIEADPEQHSDERPMSQRFMSVKAYQYRGGVQVWGGTDLYTLPSPVASVPGQFCFHLVSGTIEICCGFVRLLCRLGTSQRLIDLVTMPLSRLCEGVAMNLESGMVVDTDMALSV